MRGKEKPTGSLSRAFQSARVLGQTVGQKTMYRPLGSVWSAAAVLAVSIIARFGSRCKSGDGFMFWQIEHLDGTFLLMSPDGAFSFVVSRESLFALALYLVRVIMSQGLGEVDREAFFDDIVEVRDHLSIIHQR